MNSYTLAREAERKKWHAKWISRAGLKARLWTDKAISEFLKAPKDAGPIKAWLRKDVEAAEQTLGFKAWIRERRAKLIAKGKLDAEAPAHPKRARKAKAQASLPENVIAFADAARRLKR